MPPRLFISRHRRVLIIVVHLLPLPGSPRWRGNFKKVIRWALDDAEASADGGADAIVIENFGDVPFIHPRCPPRRLRQWPLSGLLSERRSNWRLALMFCAMTGAQPWRFVRHVAATSSG